eukprot:1142069-Pelagomonas_calceolata.AAC.6
MICLVCGTGSVKKLNDSEGSVMGHVSIRAALCMLSFATTKCGTACSFRDAMTAKIQRSNPSDRTAVWRPSWNGCVIRCEGKEIGVFSRSCGLHLRKELCSQAELKEACPPQVCQSLPEQPAKPPAPHLGTLSSMKHPASMGARATSPSVQPPASSQLTVVLLSLGCSGSDNELGPTSTQVHTALLFNPLA